MSLDAAGRANQHHMLHDILIQDMGTGIDLRQNGNRRASALPASEKRVIAESIGCASRVRYLAKFGRFSNRPFWVKRFQTNPPMLC